jgi:hypothetical protein
MREQQQWWSEQQADEEWQKTARRGKKGGRGAASTQSQTVHERSEREAVAAAWRLMAYAARCATYLMDSCTSMLLAASIHL